MSRAGKRVASLAAVAMLGTTLMVFAAPSASAADSTSFCNAVDTLNTKLDDVGGASAKNFASTYRTAGSAFKSAANSAPKKVKTAMKRIGSFLSSVGSGDFTEAAQQLGSKSGKAYSKAIVTYSTYVATNC
jgi:hypothetical protein